jgi:hypothetical protein
MPGATIELGGVGYPVLPGTYRRWRVTDHAARSGRTEIAGTFRGQRQAVLADPSRSWDATGVGPAMGGQAVEPWPAEALHPDTMPDVPTAALRAHATVAANAVYIGIGRRLYRTVPLTTGSWSSLAVVADFGAGETITSLTTLGDEVIVGLGPGTDGRRYSPAAGGHSVWRVGSRLSVALAYAGQLVYASRTGATASTAGQQERIRLSVTRHDGALLLESRWLDAPVVNMGLFNGKVAIATKTSIWLLGGQPFPGAPDDSTTAADEYRAAEWLGDPEPVFTHGLWTAEEDFCFLLGFAGRLWTWVAGAVRSWSGAAGAGWVEEGLSGSACYGGCVAGGWLVVAMRTRTDDSELWATDGNGWWRLARVAESGTRIWPVALNGAGNFDLLAFRAGATTYDLYRMIWRSAALHAFRASGEWISSLLDAGSADRKQWQRIGARFAAPEARGNPASADSLTISLAWSTDGGATWTTAATTTLAGASTRIADLEADLSGVESRHLQLKVTWSGVLDWAPALIGAWADWTTLPPRGASSRRWRFSIPCADNRVAPDGAPLPLSGRALSSALHTAWQTGAALSFKDVDHAATGLTHAARIVAFEERIPAPDDAIRWGHSTVEVELE